ncbi:cadmium-translocating P-type ATPase [Alteribacter natronophilus]|nr:heavy metal translocating P-type ATPase [Alteribacter natronophilus]TMW70359.1 cadmium-translocating P-type ATPase [Alteribacter natronophilus]
MPQRNGTMADESKTYRVKGFTCANCAAQFERNVRDLPGVTGATVNFGASKITVEGKVPPEQIEKAGTFENLKISDAALVKEDQAPFWRQRENLKVYISAILLLTAFLLQLQFGSGHYLPVSGYAASIIIGGYTLFIRGIRNLARLNFDMATLMTVAILGAAAIGEWGEGAVVVILFAISEALERYSMDKARYSIRSLMEIAPKEALVRRNGQEMTARAEDIRIGDTMIVKPGEKLAMDGTVGKGASTLNQAAITGESFPVTKNEGDEVFAGTLNGEGLLEVTVTKAADDTTLARIIHLVEEAQAERAPSQHFVDRFARWYTPAIILTALLIVTVPPLFMGLPWNEWIYRGLTVLVVGCPCALVISTPVSIVTAIGNAARHGVLIKGGIHLEAAGSLDVIAFDKTGTLTAGVPAVTDVKSFRDGKSENDVLALAAAIERGSGHPLASAIVKKAEHHGLNTGKIEADCVQSLTGKGIKATVNEEEVFAGSPKLFEEITLEKLPPDILKEIETLQTDGKTVMLIGTRTEISGLIAAADELRPSAAQVIRKLHKSGIRRTVMLTGDNRRTAEAVGKIAGVTDIASELLPEEKLQRIKEMTNRGEKTAMIGDGANDAPALAASTVGIAMGGAGTDTALETADIALMGDDLNKIPYTIRLSRRALAIIKQNITFSLAIKAAALLLVFPGWLTLWIAILADMGATLLVTLNSLRLMREGERIRNISGTGKARVV